MFLLFLDSALLTVWVVMQKYGSRGDLVSGPLGTLAGQLLIVFLMIFSIVFLRMRFTIWHYLGVVLVIGAVIVALIPAIMGGLNVASSAALVVSLIAAIPIAISQTITQYMMKHGMVDIVTLYFFVTLLQSIMTLFAIPLIPILQPNLNWWGDIGPNLRNGFLCLFAGVDSAPGDDCYLAGLWFVGFMLSALAAAIITLIIQKRMSAAASFISSSAAIPPICLCFLFLVDSLFLGTWLVPC